MIILFTDFGASDLYVGQVKAALFRRAPAVPVVDLLHDVPNHDVEAGAHLLAALSDRFSPGCVFLAVVDPGVGSRRNAAAMVADGRWYIGPDNGLLSVVAGRAQELRVWHIGAPAAGMSVSFHGRDLFAPFAAATAAGEFPSAQVQPVARLDVRLDAGDLERVVYIDHYGNAFTGLCAAQLPLAATLVVNGHEISYARVFSEAADGCPFWYPNSIGLVEIAVNRGSAAQQLGLAPASPVYVKR